MAGDGNDGKRGCWLIDVIDEHCATEMIKAIVKDV